MEAVIDTCFFTNIFYGQICFFQQTGPQSITQIYNVTVRGKSGNCPEFFQKQINRQFAAFSQVWNIPFLLRTFPDRGTDFFDFCIGMKSFKIVGLHLG